MQNTTNSVASANILFALAHIARLNCRSLYKKAERIKTTNPSTYEKMCEDLFTLTCEWSQAEKLAERSGEATC